MSRLKPCWSWPDLQTASQIDAGALRVGDAVGDAVFLAVHQPVPFERLTERGSAPVREADLLAAFTDTAHLNEPLLVFVTGDKGSGKSHMVRWLRSAVGPRDDWHIVYIEKRNTSLTRVISKVIEGLDSPTIGRVRVALGEAATDSQSLEQATLRLVSELRALMEYDEAMVVRVRTTAQEVVELADARLKTARQVARVVAGDLQLSDYLRRSGGPIERIAKLAMPRAYSTDDDDVEEHDLRLTAADLVVDLGIFDELGAAARRALQLLANESVREAVALLLDHYLPIAKARVFAGRSTDLLELFADVRREIQTRGKELCLYIEDLVLLHGIDHELAQALTVPADGELCRVRAAVAVTTGYLRNVDTFQDRGTRYSMDVSPATIDDDARRSFVARYLNVARVGVDKLVEGHAAGDRSAVPNGCINCPDRTECHDAFGVSAEGHGLFPFNKASLDQVVSLTNPERFRPREILREVVRGCVQVADQELLATGSFPSRRFASALDRNRRNVPALIQKEIEEQGTHPEQECSLRNFYTESPPNLDGGVEKIAALLGVKLTQLTGGGTGATGGTAPPPRPPTPRGSVFEDWLLKGDRIPQAHANDVRRWIFNMVHRRLENGATGHLVSKNGIELTVGSVSIRNTNIFIENAAGGGVGPGDGPSIRFEPTAANAVLLEQIRRASVGEPDLANSNWYFDALDRVCELERQLVEMADMARASLEIEPQLKVLRLSGRLSVRESQTDESSMEALFVALDSRGEQTRLRFIDRVRPMRAVAHDHLKRCFSQAQGGGAPCLLDVGAIAPALNRTRSMRHVSAEETAKALGALGGFHREFSDATWGPVVQRYNDIIARFDPSDSLDVTMKAMTELVEMAKVHGRLPYADTPTRFAETCRNLKISEAMALLDFTAKKGLASDREAHVWDLSDGAAETLEGMLRFVKESAALLDHLETVVSDTASVSEGASREALFDAFTELATILDGMVKP